MNETSSFIKVLNNVTNKIFFENFKKKEGSVVMLWYNIIVVPIYYNLEEEGAGTYENYHKWKTFRNYFIRYPCGQIGRIFN